MNSKYINIYHINGKSKMLGSFWDKEVASSGYYYYQQNLTIIKEEDKSKFETALKDLNLLE